MHHSKISYIEFPSRDLTASKEFFQSCFGWQFIDYGPEYASFKEQGVAGGFFHAKRVAKTLEGAPLIVLYSEGLETTMNRVEQHGGVVIKRPFEFPGGRRFHFIEPGGNELAVWSDH